MKNLEMCKNHKGVFGVLVVFVIIFLGSLIISEIVEIQNKMGESENKITVSATAEVYAKPDLALTNFSVITEEKTVEEAVQNNTEKMNTVIASMKEQGIEEKDLKTTLFNIYPRYEWREKALFEPQGERILVGYEIRQTLEVKIRDMEKIGDILDAGVKSGANQVGNLQFTIDNEDELKNQAREQAIEEAKEKAKALASQLGISLVRVSSFSESGTTPWYYGLEKSYALPEDAGGGSQVETGENKIEVTVSIVYDIR